MIPGSIERYATVGFCGGTGASVLSAVVQGQSLVTALLVGSVIGTLVGALYGRLRGRR